MDEKTDKIELKNGNKHLIRNDVNTRGCEVFLYKLQFITLSSFLISWRNFILSLINPIVSPKVFFSLLHNDLFFLFL